MSQHPVDLSSHLNQSVHCGHPADFPVTLQPLSFDLDGIARPVPHRLAVVREDTGQALAVVSDRYTFVPHQRILDLVDAAIRPLDVGSVPRGIYVDRGGAQMRALFKFPGLAQAVSGGDEICPCLQVRNTYDATARIAIHIGAFRFVCTNLAVGGGGVFASGFMSIHAGEIPMEDVTAQLSAYLSGFDAIVILYRVWRERPFEQNCLAEILTGMPTRTATAISDGIARLETPSVYDAYNSATWVATHQMRSARTAFELLARINSCFQERFPLVVN